MTTREKILALNLLFKLSYREIGRKIGVSHGLISKSLHGSTGIDKHIDKIDKLLAKKMQEGYPKPKKKEPKKIKKPLNKVNASEERKLADTGNIYTYFEKRVDYYPRWILRVGKGY